MITLLGISALVALDPALGAAPSERRVAAINYTGNTAPDGDTDCEDQGLADVEEEVCEVEALIREAAGEGALVIVVNEGAIEAEMPELLPKRGGTPDPDGAPILRTFAELADELNAYIILPMHLQATLDEPDRIFSSQVALGPVGRVVAVHHKVELYSEERDEFVAGKEFSTFSTPIGRVAMMLCSDLYADPELHERMVRSARADIVAISSLWTAPGARRWQAAVAHDWGVSVVAANGSRADGRGSGIYSPEGIALASSDSGFDEVVLADLDGER